MVFGGGSSNDVEIKVTVDADGAIKAFDNLGNEVEKIDEKANAAETGFSKMQASIVTLQSAIGLATIAFGAMTGAAGIALASINRGSEVDDIASSFENLSNKAGVASDVLLNQLSNAVGGTITDFDLMKQANELLLAGIKPDQFEGLAKAARSIGEATGKSAKEGMEALSDSLLRGNDRALKSIGIIVNVSKAQEDFAKALGKTKDQLTEEEKALATREASLKALAEQQQRLGDVTDDASDLLAQFGVQLSNAKDEFARALANNKDLNEALKGLNVAIKGINLKQFAADIASIGASFLGVAKHAVTFGKTLVNILGETSRAFKGQDTQVNDGFANLLQYFSFIPGLGNAFQEMSIKTRIANKDLIETNAEIAKLQNYFDGLSTEIDQSTFAFKEFVGPVLPGIKEATDSVNKLGEAVKETTKKASESAKQNPIRIPIKIGNKGANKAGGANAELDDEFSDLEQSAITIGNILADGITRGLDEGFNRESGVNLLGAIGKAFAPEQAGPLIDLGTALLNRAVEHIFGGENAGTTARKAADKFFADAFDANRLQVIINGQLREIQDLVFQGSTLFGGDSQFTDGSFSTFFESLPDQARQAFAGVGLAFEELLGVSGDISGQIAAVLANNIGGSLNNLQLLVGATGKSFEELRGFVVEAFLDGKISALEAQSALNGLAQVAQEGIPDGIGFTIQAFQNLKAAGEKGGRALVDAIKDIGFEAKEIGIRDFGALQNQIAASGQFTAEEIQQVFDALRSAGITSIDQLTAASTEQLLPVLSQLQAQDFPFADAAQGAAELIETINDLPNEKTLTFNIKTNFDGNTKAAQEQGYIPKYAESGGSVSY